MTLHLRVVLAGLLGIGVFIQAAPAIPQTAPAAATPSNPSASANARPASPGNDAVKDVLRVDVDLVLVNVTVTDRRNRYVQSLSAEQFQVWEDRIQQEVSYFSTEDAPLSLGLIVDRSGSMGGSGAVSLDFARRGALNCLQDGIREDEYFMIEFADKAEVTADFTRSVEKLKDRLIVLGSGGNTALYDAIYSGVAKLQDASHSRRALVVLTDGEENQSRYSLSELKAFLQEQDVRIYFIGEGNNQLAELTGGRVFTDINACQKLKADLQTQYVLGYRPTNRAKDGKWREIRVRIDNQGLTRELSDLSIRARAGYYAGAQP